MSHSNQPVRPKPRSFVFHGAALMLLLAIDAVGQSGKFLKNFGRSIAILLLTLGLFCMVALSMRSLAMVTRQTDQMMNSSLLLMDQMLVLRGTVGDLQSRLFRIRQGVERPYERAEVEAIDQQITDINKVLEASGLVATRQEAVSRVERALKDLMVSLDGLKIEPTSPGYSEAIQLCSDHADTVRFAVRTAIEQESVLLRNTMQRAKQDAGDTLAHIVSGWKMLGVFLVVIALLWLIARWFRAQFGVAVTHAKTSK